MGTALLFCLQTGSISRSCPDWHLHLSEIILWELFQLSDFIIPCCFSIDFQEILPKGLVFHLTVSWQETGTMSGTGCHVAPHSDVYQNWPAQLPPHSSCLSSLQWRMGCAVVTGLFTSPHWFRALRMHSDQKVLNGLSAFDSSQSSQQSPSKSTFQAAEGWVPALHALFCFLHSQGIMGNRTLMFATHSS